jgi:hypothetical protein
MPRLDGILRTLNNTRRKEGYRRKTPWKTQKNL